MQYYKEDDKKFVQYECGCKDTVVLAEETDAKSVCNFDFLHEKKKVCVDISGRMRTQEVLEEEMVDFTCNDWSCELGTSECTNLRIRMQKGLPQK